MHEKTILLMMPSVNSIKQGSLISWL